MPSEACSIHESGGKQNWRSLRTRRDTNYSFCDCRRLIFAVAIVRSRRVCKKINKQKVICALARSRANLRSPHRPPPNQIRLGEDKQHDYLALYENRLQWSEQRDKRYCRWRHDVYHACCCQFGYAEHDRLPLSVALQGGATRWCGGSFQWRIGRGRGRSGTVRRRHSCRLRDGTKTR